MKNIFLYALSLPLLTGMVSCMSDTQKANEVIADAIRMSEAASDTLGVQNGKLPSQTSEYTNPVKKVPTQDELIASCKVKTIRKTYKDGWSLCHYDKKGHMTSEESDYSGKKTYTYAFDQDGRVTKEKTKYKDGSIFTIDYTYNTAGKITERKHTDSDGKISIIKYEYDTILNTRTEISNLGKDKEFYDNRGLRVHFESYDDHGKLMGSGDAIYDKDGLKLSENGKILGMNNRDVFEYNEAGQLHKQHRTGIVDVQFIYEYDDKGLIRTFTTIGGLSAGEDTYEYTFY